MSKKTEKQLHQINQVLEKAFFAPLHFNDWLGFYLNQPFLMGLAPDELKDLFTRCVLVEQRLNPDLKREPLNFIIESSDQTAMLAQALASLKDDRPFLLHRAIANIPSLVQGEVDPNEYETLEEMLEEALESGVSLSMGAKQEIKALRKQALDLLDDNVDRKLLNDEVARLLKSEKLADIHNEAQLRLWVSMGDGAAGIDPKLLPHVLVEVWTAWVGLVTGANPEVDFLLTCRPGLRLSDQVLESYTPPSAEERPSLSATCPYCQGANVIDMDEQQIVVTHRCPHLIFIGTNDPMHLLRILLLAPAEMGEDMVQLLNSYYNSASDLEMFASIISDLYQMLLNQNRIKEVPVTNMPSGHSYSNLRAYFAHPQSRGEDH